MVSGGFQTEEAHELFLYIIDDKDLYHQRMLPIYQNLTKKMKNGTYDTNLATKLFMYLADDGAKKYSKEYSDDNYGSDWSKVFPKSVRLDVAEGLKLRFESAYKNKEFDFMKDSYDMKLKNLAPKEGYSPSVQFAGKGNGRLVWEKK